MERGDLMNNNQDIAQERKYLACESRWTFLGLMLVAGMFGAYTYNLRGGVFCNAQTANLVLFAMELGRGKFLAAAYYLIPIGAYFLGAVVSEVLASSVKKLGIFRWDTILIGFEVVVTIVLGFLPASSPDQITQVALNFICSMQFNTFRQFEGTPMATTFCTNHIRQFGSNLVKYIRNNDKAALLKIKKHGSMLLMFTLGATLCTVACLHIAYRAIWLSTVCLLSLFIYLAIEDRTIEKDMLYRVPKGH